MSIIEAVYIFNEHNSPILSHTFTSRPPPPSTLLPLYLAHSAPRPSCVYLTQTNPPTLLFSILQDNLLFLAPSCSEVEPLVVLEFLHRVADALEEFLGAPLLASKIESSYDVIAQVLSEMCDGGLVSGTEANALRDVVETPTWMGKLLGGVGLPSSGPTLGASGMGSSGGLKPTLSPTLSSAGSQIPWRRSNVRHTSNELYVDIVETLSVTYAPSGAPLAAFAHGSIAFTSKVSGVPDLLLTLTTGSSSGSGSGDRGAKVRRTMERPVFHPCVRLARWRDHGELSFVPPDGRFVLAGYEVDLLDPSVSPLAAQPASLNLPASIDVKTGLGASGTDFEVRLRINKRWAPTGRSPSPFSSSNTPTNLGSSSSSTSAATTSLSTNLRPGPALRGLSGNPDPKSPALEDITVAVPLPPSVRNISDLRPSKGEAHWSPGDTALEWKLSGREAAALGSAGAVLRCSLVGAVVEDEGAEDEEDAQFAVAAGNGARADTYEYTDDDTDAVGARAGGGGRGGGGYQDVGIGDGRPQRKHRSSRRGGGAGAATDRRTPSAAADADAARRIRQNAALMPSSASLSFGVKGWLASGVRVEGLVVDVKRSKGLGEGVRPYKGVKYLTVSRGGIEVRC